MMVIVAILALLFECLKFVGGLLIIIGAGYGVYALFMLVAAKIKRISDSRIECKKEKIVAELSDEIKYRKDTFIEIEKFFSERKQNIMFLKLITICSGTTSLLECYEELENNAFSKLKNSVADKYRKEKNIGFPTSVSDIDLFVASKSKEIEEYKEALNSVASADSAELDRIMLTYCKKLKKEKVRKKRKRIAIFASSTLAVVTLILVLSNSFAMMIAENYHKSVLNEKIKELGYDHLVVKDIEYEQQSLFLDDNEYNYNTYEIQIICDVPFLECFVENSDSEKKRIYNQMDVNINYFWAGQKLCFENDDKYVVYIIDKEGKKINIQ